ncbi:MAG: hypothetical protein A3H71_03575 [Candidatus Sungbacteria bacterium RIFCSPLOWO2_02_FULL_48_13b]|uniref:Uncharacterized protein n=2 Tax=Candidatus Sungiibacteriota TaxID=1817917 RepID=A0A1G2LGE3_9BACT|nr:MAG: hypothetical protein A3C12_00470 [Candidatus Sungbacteria bacterium RIFCSPHIGHO2_02_FULL_49_20]OHA10697.1 MAG: hypothetical protein A3H71_03575 [Candidatus Sungbacteria bacterium RIFCSPLOWO2_02_FULL_48_13b]
MPGEIGREVAARRTLRFSKTHRRLTALGTIAEILHEPTIGALFPMADIGYWKVLSHKPAPNSVRVDLDSVPDLKGLVA